MKRHRLFSEKNEKNINLSSAESFWRVVKVSYCSLETHKRVIGKQCRPRSDAAECGV